MEHILQPFDEVFGIRFLVALAVGALIGLERERHREGRTVLAGIRTYPLAAVAGVIFTHIGTALGNDIYVAIGAAVFGGFSLVLFWIRHALGLHGLTSPVAFFLTYIAGALIGLGFVIEGVVSGVAVAVLLFTKARLHRLAEVMTEEEMSGALQFVVVAFILYPIVPSGAVDPWGLVIPKKLLLIIIFVAAISFASFLAMRYFGSDRGLQVSGMLGGLVNSEATAGSLAGIAAAKDTLFRSALAAIVLTNATMILRNLAIAAFVDPSFEVVKLMAAPLVVMFLVHTVFAVRAQLDRPEPETAIRLGNPFAIGPALQFGVLFLALQVVSFALGQIPGAGDKAVLLTALGGLVSSAAVVASVAQLAVAGEVSTLTAAATAVLSVIVSTLNKLVLVRGIHAPLLRPLAVRLLLPAAIGAVVLAAMVAMV